MPMSRAVPVFVLAALGAAVVAQAKPLRFDHVEVELVSEASALVPGERNWVGLRLKHEPHWHTYWINPGDSGLPTRLDWSLPDGISAGPIAWPAPQRFDVGGLTNFGYDGDLLLPIPLEVADTLEPGTIARLTVEARWLVCREECIPGKARLQLAVPVARQSTPKPRERKAFASARAALPHASAWTGLARFDGESIRITLSGQDLPPPDHLDAFVEQGNVVAYALPQVDAEGEKLTVAFTRNEYLTEPPPTLDLVIVEGQPPLRRAHRISVPFASAKPSANDPGVPP
jgi:thiol:disulfide interchange protein DsbD